MLLGMLRARNREYQVRLGLNHCRFHEPDYRRELLILEFGVRYYNTYSHDTEGKRNKCGKIVRVDEAVRVDVPE